MCRSRAEGGQRCHTHAKQKLVTAGQAYGNAIAVGMLNMNQIRRTYDRLVVAEQEYASTKDGAASLRATLAGDNVPVEIRTRLTEALTVGAHLRERNKIVQHNAAALDAQGLLPGCTDTPGTDEMLRKALTDIRANPDRCRNPHPAGPLLGVKTYTTRARQDYGVARWAQGVDQAARVYADALRFAEMANDPEGPNSPPGYSDRLTEAALRLVAMSERLRVARAQNPPA